MRLIYLCLLSVLLVAVGCIKNDIPYPHKKALITEIEFKGQKTVEIDNENMTVSVLLGEDVDLRNVEITKFIISEGATSNPVIEPLPYTMDLSEEQTITLTNYRDYTWTIRAEIDVKRGADVGKQVGKSIFNEETKSVSIMIAEDADLSNVKVNSIRFADPANSTVSPDPKTVTNFTSPVQFSVTQFGEKVDWTVTISKAPIATVNTDEVWAKRAVLIGNVVVLSGSSVGFEYKKSSDPDYAKVTTIQYDEGRVMATIVTDPSTTYQYRVYQNGKMGNVLSFTTESAPSIPNLGFEDWYKNKKTWFPCLESEYGKAEDYKGFWNTGNSGVTLFLESNVYPTDDAVSGKAACLETIGSVPLVGMAAGSFFVGNFITDVISPLKSPKFGRPFIGRPTKVTGKYKYFPTAITISDEKKTPEMIKYKGELDRCIVWANLEDWGGATARPANPTIIARAVFQEYGTVSDYKEFEMVFDYRIKNHKPTHLCFVISSSEFGDFYTGGIGTKLYVDDFQLIY